MIKKEVKQIFYIFIYILMTGCENIVGPVCSECYLDVDAPSLTMDENGYYHIQFLDGYSQTFTTLKAETGITDYYQKVNWISNQEYSFGNSWVNLVNGNSYTDDEGNAYTVLSVWQEFVGDTIKVYSGYNDECNFNHIDSIGVIVNE